MLLMAGHNLFGEAVKPVDYKDRIIPKSYE